jgi:hypothetical protein
MRQRTRTARRLLGGLISALLVASCDNSSEPSPSGITITSLVFAAPAVTISQGEARVLAITAKDASGAVLEDASRIQWTSDNTALLSVTQSGEIRGVALGGPVTVNASIDGVTASATVNVVPARVAFSPVDSNIVLGSTLQLSGTLLDHAGLAIASNAEVVWASSNPGVANIGSSSGLVTTLSSGEATISASAAGRTTTRTFRVGVPSPYDGRWTGAFGQTASTQGRTLTTSFEVIFGRVYGFEMKLAHAFVVTAGGTQINCAFVVSSQALTNSAIADDAFTTSVPSTVGTSSTVVGSFASPTSLSGTHAAISFGGPAVCGMIGGTGFSTNTGVLASTWTASRAP